MHDTLHSYGTGGSVFSDVGRGSAGRKALPVLMRSLQLSNHASFEDRGAPEVPGIELRNMTSGRY